LNNAKQMELAAQAVYALRKCQFSYGKHVLVTGCDPLSIMIGAVAKNTGAASVVLGVIDNEQEKKAKLLGFEVYHYRKEDPADMAKRITGKRKFDLIFETQGTVDAYEAIIKTAKRGGRVAVIGILEEPLNCHICDLIRDQICFYGIKGADDTSREIAGKLLKGGSLDYAIEAID
jgi:L-iditol 2-dehydrogenase